ncbi:MAG: glycoside hydrolase family 16 protein, partial [Actinomycetota bacterium]
TGTGRYWNPDLGDWQDDWLWYDATVPDPAPPTSAWSFTFDPAGTDGSGLYRVTAFAWDGTGTKDPEGHRVRFTSDTDGPNDWSLVWSDEFDGPGLDPSRWKAFTGEYGTPYRDQYYTARPDNVRVEDGALVLEAHDETWGARQHTSGMVVSNDASLPAVGATRGNLSWRYGRFEVRARTPDVAGVWPAFWLRPADSVYGPWPRSGEIDILEYAGPTPQGHQHPLGRFFSAALHTWDPSVDGTGGSKKHEGVRPVDAAFFDEFHTFAVEWEPDRFRWYLDGELFHTADRDWLAPGASFPAPFDQPFFITLNLQLDGYAGPVADEQLPASFEIDWVRVYQ